MKKIMSVILAIVMAFCQITPVLGAASDSTGTDLEIRTEEKVYANATLAHNFAEDGVFVVLSNKASLEFKRFQAADFPEIGCTAVTDFSSASGEKIKSQVGILSKKSATTRELQSVDKEKIQIYNQVLYLTLPNPGKQNVLDAIEQLMLREDVIYAGPNYYYAVELDEPSTRSLGNAQTYLKLGLPAAWARTTGDPNLLVGVLDTGIEATHPDLFGKVDTNLSRDFTSGTAVQGGCTDSDGHGTRVAGIIAAQGSVNTGVKGVSPGVTLVSLKVIPNEGPASTAVFSRAICYAEEQNIRLLNCSMGWQVGQKGDEETEEEWEDLASQSVWENFTGLIVCGAGNQGADNDEILNYPSCLDIDNLISVGASLVNDMKHENSNVGEKSVDLFAPGDNIESTYGNDDYRDLDQTSAAAPFVTGTAALIWSLCPDMTPLQVKQTIMNSVDSVSGLQGYCVTGGRLNVYEALLNMQHPWMYTSQSATSHLASCVCGEQHIESHTWSYLAQGLTSHLVYCVCGNQRTESHSWLEMGTKYRCGMCGYLTNAIPGIIRKLDDEEQGS